MASIETDGAPPAWFRIVALIAMAWNLFGVAMYLSSVGMFGDPTAGLSEPEQAFAASIPVWIFAAFAIGTFAGLLGSLALVMRGRWAWPVLILSLVALIILEGWIVFFGNAPGVSGIALPVIVTLVAALLAWLAKHGQQKGWLR